MRAIINEVSGERRAADGARDGALPARPPEGRVRGRLPRERGDGPPGARVRVQPGRDREVPDVAAPVAGHAGRTVDRRSPRAASSTTSATWRSASRRAARPATSPPNSWTSATAAGAEDYAGKDVKGKIVLGSAVEQPAAAARRVRTRRRRRRQLQPDPPRSRHRSDRLAERVGHRPAGTHAPASAGRCRRASAANWRAASRAARRSRCDRS